MSGHWKERPEGGGRFAIWLIRSIAQVGGRAVSRVLLLPITLYFLLVRGPERRASRAYLGRVLGRPAGWRIAPWGSRKLADRWAHCMETKKPQRVSRLFH